MSDWENAGKSSEWYTPEYVFDALGCRFSMDVASPLNKLTFVPAYIKICSDSLGQAWGGFVWMNSPFEGRNGLVPWLNKFFDHGNGICLTPDRTSTDWWHDAAEKADAIFYVRGKIKFIDEFGKIGKSPSNGTTLFAVGKEGVKALINAEKNGLGRCYILNKKVRQ